MKIKDFLAVGVWMITVMGTFFFLVYQLIRLYKISHSAGFIVIGILIWIPLLYWAVTRISKWLVER